MSILLHLGVFLLAFAIVWTLSGMLVNAVDRVAKRYNKTGFGVAFFVLGLMTSIGEISVAFNSTLKGVPQVSAGNLVGASIVIFFLIMPLLAILSKRVEVDHVLRPSNLAFALCMVALPSFLAMNGSVDRGKGILLLLLYATLLYSLYKRKPIERMVEEAVAKVEQELLHKRRATIADLAYIVGGGVIIFFAGNILVDKSIFFTDLLGVPRSLAGLLVLSIGTNVPELIIAVRSVLKGQTDIAFGDYIGSAVANALLFGLLALVNDPFAVDATEFRFSFILMTAGFLLFFLFSRSKKDINRREGFALLCIYLCFVLLQIGSVAL